MIENNILLDKSLKGRLPFLQLQTTLNLKERDAEVRKILKDLDESYKRGSATRASLELEDVWEAYGKWSAQFYYRKKSSMSKFRKGECVVIFDDDEDIIGSAVIKEIKRSSIVLTFDNNPYHLKEYNYYKMQNLPSTIVIDRILESIISMGDNHRYIPKLLFNECSLAEPHPCVKPKLTNKYGTLRFYNEELDAQQRAAVEFALKQQDLAVIHGPPGTGKTTTVVELILQHVRMGVKVFALAHSNIAVDNLGERLQRRVNVVRLGSVARTTSAVQARTLDALLYERSSRNRRQLVLDADVVLSTLSSLQGNRMLEALDQDHFGLTVIDECSQATEASTYACLGLTTKLVLAGDHKQLPPVVLSQDNSPLEMSLMERCVEAYGRRVTRMLSVQYRMNSAIMQFSSDVFYGGRLVAADSVKTRRLCDLPGVACIPETESVLTLIDTAGCLGFRETCHDKGGGSSSHSNKGEAYLVKHYLTKLIRAGVQQHEIGVISPYMQQISVLSDMLHRCFPEVEVRTVDGYQGREKEAIIISMVRSNPSGKIGFLSEPRRLNVAVTRARRQLCVAADSETLRSAPVLARFVGYLSERGSRLSAEELRRESMGHREPAGVKRAASEVDSPAAKRSRV